MNTNPNLPVLAIAALGAYFNVTPDVLVNWNSKRYPSLLSNPNHIEPGWVICMPFNMLTNTPSPKRTP